MPIVTPTAPFDTVGYVMNLARAMVNDAAQTIAGNLLADSQPYVPKFLNAGWRMLQRRMANRGIEDFAKETVFTNISASTATDPVTQCYINWSNYFDGVTLQASPVLPQDLMVPLRLWERQTGSQDQFTEMRPSNDGLPAIPPTSQYRYWEWRGASAQPGIYFIPANQANDIRLRYQAYLADFAAPASSSGADIATFDAQVVPIMHAGEPLAAYICAAFAQARGSPMAPTFEQKGEDFITEMVLASVRKKQRGQHRRRRYGARSRIFGYGW